MYRCLLQQSLGGAPPKLSTLKINYYKPPVTYSKRTLRAETVDMDDCVHVQCLLDVQSESIRRSKGAFKSYRGKSSLADDLTIENQDEEYAKAQVNVLASKTEASMSSTGFVIPRQSTIDSDGKPHKVTIGILDLTSTFIYTVVPKMSLHAYLKASTVNTSDKPLLAGPVSVFMDNNFVTHSSIDNVCVDDTFDLPLGIDISVKVEIQTSQENG
ncbi:unnamed protein product [Rotaria sp. Silwood1]|nr:unnamed protein product [Rotaria sp. Silwood1]